MKNNKNSDLTIFDGFVTVAFIVGWLLLSLHMSGDISLFGGNDDSEYDVNFRVIKYEYATQFDEELEEALASLEPEVGIIGTKINRDTLYDLEYSTFWLKNYSSYDQELIDPETGEVVDAKVYRFRYEVPTTEELEARKAEVDAEINRIISIIPYDADAWTAVRIVHDELCRSSVKDQTLTKEHIYDSYGVLVNGEAVCNGYALAFNEIMCRLGIPSERVCSETHAWNTVSIGSETYEVDITWDDTDTLDEYGNELINYTYFCLTREEMSVSHPPIISKAA